MQTGPGIAPSLQPQAPSGTNLQAIDTDIQGLTRSVNRIGEILTQLIPGTPPSVTGSRGGNLALASLLTALAAKNMIVDNTTP